MKKHLFVLAILALALHACGPVYVVRQDPPPVSAPPQDPEPEVSYQSFYDQLSPYGQWIDDPSQGYVWLPDVGPDFKPYATNGQWVYTEDGWTWASDYPWGWATFHYGRWFFQDGYGWMWMPGTEWAPAWVSWRSSDDYYGWAPLAPNVSMDVSFGGGYNPPPQYWSFVPHQYVGSPQIRKYYVNTTRNVTIINKTTIINNVTIVNNGNTPDNQGNGRPRNVNYGRGPDPREVGRYSGAAIRPVVLRQSNTPGEQFNNGTLAIYRPRVNSAPQGNNGNGNGNPPRMAPSRVQTLDRARPVNTAVYNRNGTDNRGNDNRGNDGGNGNNNRPPANQPAVLPAGQPVTRPTGNTPDRSYNPPSPAPSNQNPAAGQPANGRPFERPITQPSSQQPVNRPFTPPVNRPSVNQPAVQPAAPPADRSPGQPTQPVNQQPVNRPFTPPVNRPSVNRPAVQPVNRPVPPPPGTVRPNPAANPPRPAPRPVSPPPPPKKDGDRRDTRQQ